MHKFKLMFAIETVIWVPKTLCFGWEIKIIIFNYPLLWEAWNYLICFDDFNLGMIDSYCRANQEWQWSHVLFTIVK